MIAEGTIEWSRCINGVDMVLSERHGPTYAGASNLLTGDPAVATGRASTPARVVTWDADSFLAFLHGDAAGDADGRAADRADRAGGRVERAPAGEAGRPGHALRRARPRAEQPGRRRPAHGIRAGRGAGHAAGHRPPVRVQRRGAGAGGASGGAAAGCPQGCRRDCVGRRRWTPPTARTRWPRSSTSWAPTAGGWPSRWPEAGVDDAWLEQVAEAAGARPGGGAGVGGGLADRNRPGRRSCTSRRRASRSWCRRSRTTRTWTGRRWPRSTCTRASTAR